MIRLLLASDRIQKPTKANQPRDLALAGVLDYVADRAASHLVQQITRNKGFSTDFVPLDSLTESLTTRARLGLTYHAAVITAGGVCAVDHIIRAAEMIRRIDGSQCLASGLRVNCLPIVLCSWATGIWKPEHDARSESVIHVRIHRMGNNLDETILQALGEWCQYLLQELEYVGYGVDMDEQGNPRVSPVVRSTRRESAFISEWSTPGSLRRSGLFRLPKDLAEDWGPYSDLENVLRRVRDLDRKKQERELHRCLDRHPILLYQERYSAHWSEPHLRHPDPLQKSIVPDFVLKPKTCDTSWKVQEIKTSEEHVVRRGRFTGFFLDAMDQLRRRYADFFHNPVTKQVQKERFGQAISKPRLALLIGRALSPEGRELVQAAQKESPWGDVELRSYDDLLDFGISAVRLQLRLNFHLRTP